MSETKPGTFSGSGEHPEGRAAIERMTERIKSSGVPPEEAHRKAVESMRRVSRDVDGGRG